MKLKGLKLQGFKSFPDPTEIDFHDGITAIVGPNGCGKSNIGDAIRWVLGEQRPTAIRGAKMEEAIFQGTVSRRPVNRGYVSLVVSNEDGALPVPFEEVELGRTVYRDGGSDYAINRASCRLKDVLDLCRDTGLGANAYAIIENRMVDAILSDRAEERRGLFEEAAGIGRYKDRRKAALRRLDRAEIDLQRLDDVIGEVQTKVRSLARQKGKAQRHQALRDRRLAVEVAVVRNELDLLRTRLREVERELAGDREMGEGHLAELRASEAQFETLKIRQVEAQKARSEAAQEVDGLRQEAVQWERDLAVAQEKAGYARRRMGQIVDEKRELKAQQESVEGERAELETTQNVLTGELETLTEEREARTEVVQDAREALEEARGALTGVEGRLRDLARRQAHLEGEVSSAESQSAELSRHLERLQREMEDATHSLADLESQGDLFADQVVQFQAAVDRGRGAVESAKERARNAREALNPAREEEVIAKDAVSALRTRIETLEGMEESREGLEPTVKAALELNDTGVLGTLGDFVGGDPEVVRAVEAFLGPLLQGLVVEGGDVVARLGEWYRKEFDGRGGLVLLPLDRLSSEISSESGTLLDALELREPGGQWIRWILGSMDLESARSPSEVGAAAGFLSPSGLAVDAHGIVRLGNPLGSSGILERRERTKLLREELREASERLASAEARREEAEVEAAGAEEELEEAREALRGEEDAHRSAMAQAQAQSDRQSRLDRHQEELARQIEGTRASRERALERGEGAREERALIEEEMEGLREEEASAGARVEKAQERWEEARAMESRVTVEIARKEAERDRLLQRRQDLDAALTSAGNRLDALYAEEKELKEEEEWAVARKAEGETALADLFEKRDAADEELRKRDEAVDRITASLQDAERRVRDARLAEREALDRRHRQELEQKDLVGKITGIQERLEGEWGRPLEALLAEAEPVEGDREELREELREIVLKLEKIGPVNMLAVEEHQEESARLEFLLEQREDLREARDDLKAAIRQINETATQLFEESFEKIRENFRSTFQRLFQGGEADLWLEEGDDPLESTIEIHASPRGKKTQRIDLLSGGERALTALSLLFGIYLVKPSPFCVLDEVDAPLDESNIYRFIRLLQEFKNQTQFIVITHNARTIEAADWIYGVTMEEPGVSRIVGVRLEDALQVSGPAP